MQHLSAVLGPAPPGATPDHLPLALAAIGIAAILAHRIAAALRRGRGDAPPPAPGRRGEVACRLMAEAARVAEDARRALEARWQASTPWRYDRAMIECLAVLPPPALAAPPAEIALLDLRAQREVKALGAAIARHNRALAGTHWSIAAYSAAVARLDAIEVDARALAGSMALMADVRPAARRRVSRVMPHRRMMPVGRDADGR